MKLETYMAVLLTAFAVMAVGVLIEITTRIH